MKAENLYPNPTSTFQLPFKPRSKTFLFYFLFPVCSTTYLFKGFNNHTILHLSLSLSIGRVFVHES